MAKDLTGQQAGTVKGDAVNDPSVRVIRGKNNFPQSFMHPSTCRYGEVDPVFCFKGERGDVIPYKIATDLNTYTLASPMKSEVNMYSAAFKVPMYGIYPRNWDIMLPIPNKGDDVPADTRALLSPITLANRLYQGILYSHEAPYSQKSLTGLIRNTLLLEYIFSAGSLFSKFNMHFDSMRFVVTDGTTTYGSMVFDEYFDTHFIPWLKSVFQFDGDPFILSHYDAETSDYFVTFDDSLIGTKYNVNTYYISFRRALELLRTGEYTLNRSEDSVNATFPYVVVTGNSAAINIEPIVSYQLACSQFFTNTKIDYVYSAELYRDNMQSLIYGEDGRVPTFEWNGLIKQYDVFSQKCFLDALVGLVNPDRADYYNHTSFWFNLLSYARSLRYGDYFTGAHPEPLAVGDINAPVINGTVNALDMTRKLQMTRLLNKVNISGPRIGDYLTALFGGSLPEAPKDVPIRLSLEKFNVSGFEVNNTGAQQASEDATNITTTNLRLTASKYLFEASIDEPCWLVVVQYFDAHRIYSKTMDRFAYHRNRYDDFIPDMQFVGDQDVKTSELDAINGDETKAFAYNLRNMEYKNRYSYASGGFIRNLPSWAFITDNYDGNPMSDHIDPDYIRSSPSEFDRFYKSLTGYSLGSYFHFITTNTNVVSPYRQMVYAPEILA